MAKKYEVSVRFTKKVSKAGLANAVRMATKVKAKGFTMGDLSTHEDYDSPTQAVQPVRIVKKSKATKRKK